jgi:hypothetical protein
MEIANALGYECIPIECDHVVKYIRSNPDNHESSFLNPKSHRRLIDE